MFGTGILILFGVLYLTHCTVTTESNKKRKKRKRLEQAQLGGPHSDIQVELD